ncbi:hypothetical protein NM189_005537, partial [Klebsiella pneumoniae]|uniref:hypothetical protein n=1 Tax=Klebsiella pneumoniae TaxID=573 RepID=UPI003510D021
TLNNKDYVSSQYLVFWKNSKCQVLEKTICFTVGYSTKSMPGIKRYRLSLRAGGCHTPRQVSGRHTPHFSMD